MKKIVFSIFLIGSSISISAQVDNKSAGTPQNQRGAAGRMPDTSTRPSSNYDALRLNNTNSFQDSRNAGFQQSNNWHKMDLQEQRETVKNMSPKERSQLMQTIKENTAIEELNVPLTSQAEFKVLLNDYMARQKEIKEKFKTDKKIEKLSNEEAQEKLNESFDIGQKLLDNRKNFAEKFLKILTPQQVLKLYQIEGKFRDKMLDKKYD